MAPRSRRGTQGTVVATKNVTGDCRMCLAEGVPLRDSHIIPKWAYRRARDTRKVSGSAHPVRIEDGVAIQTSAQISEHMLCNDCEQRLGRDEDYVSKLAYQEDETLGLAKEISSNSIVGTGLRMAGVELRGVDISHLDCGALARFAASVFWRAHVARTHSFSQLRIWKAQAEALRRFLMQEAPLPHRTCVTMHVPAGDEGSLTSIASGMLFTPATGKKGDDSLHQFMVPGLLFNLTTGSLSRPELCLACGRSPHATLQHWKSIRILMNAAGMMRDAVPKGRVARLPRFG
jgi:hypothetical protein